MVQSGPDQLLLRFLKITTVSPNSIHNVQFESTEHYQDIYSAITSDRFQIWTLNSVLYANPTIYEDSKLIKYTNECSFRTNCLEKRIRKQVTFIIQLHNIFFNLIWMDKQCSRPLIEWSSSFSIGQDFQWVLCKYFRSLFYWSITFSRGVESRMTVTLSGLFELQYFPEIQQQIFLWTQPNQKSIRPWDVWIVHLILSHYFRFFLYVVLHV